MARTSGPVMRRRSPATHKAALGPSALTGLEHLVTGLSSVTERAEVALEKLNRAAAAIFDRLDMGVLLDVVSRMAETKASAVIARMEPARARQLTTELAAREELAGLDR